MKKRLHHIAPLFFLSLLLLPFAVLLFLQGAQWYLKSRADERMKTEKTETVVLNTANVNWEKPGKELLIDGKFFDVEHYTVSNNTLTATGFFDHEETGIFSLLTLWHHGKKSGTLQRLFFLFQCFAACIFFLQPAIFLRESTRLQYSFKSYLPRPFLFVIKQPPRC